MRKMLNWKLFLEEIEISLSELDKVKDGKPRGDVLVQKLKIGEPIITNNNKPVIISKMKDDSEWVQPEEAVDNLVDNEGNYDSKKAKEYLTKGNRYSPVFMDESGDQFKLNQFKKTKEFGSSGAGRLIKEFESVQCIFLAIKQFYPDVLLSSHNLLSFYRKFKESYENDRLVYLSDDIEVDDKLLSDFLQDPNWVASFCRIPNKIWLNRNNIINKDFRYKIYHISYKGVDSPYNIIQKKYTEFSKENKISINFAKYCPADVYLIESKSSSKIIEKIRLTKNLTQMTELLDRLFNKKLFFPLSLKKVTKSSDFKIIINKEEGKELPNFSIQEFFIGSGLRGISSKISTTSIWKHRNNKDVDIKSRKINFDSSDTSKKQNIDGEIEGSSSRHGKVSFNLIKRLLNEFSEYDLQELKTYSELRDMSISELEAEVIRLTNVIKSHGEIYNIIRTDKVVDVDDKLRANDISGHEGKLISRVQSLQVILAFLQLYLLDKSMANSLITRMMRYALSIQTDSFETPRYLRVI